MRFKYLFIISIAMLAFVACDRPTEKRKIKLSEGNPGNNLKQQFTSTIRLEPKERRTIAVMFFQNLTGDNNLQWLQKGLTEMFIRALSQSSSLSILTTDRVHEIIDRVTASGADQNIDMDVAAIIGREANAEAIILGQIRKRGDQLTINIKLQETTQGLILKEESVDGHGLEAIFDMVDELTRKVKNDLQLTFEKAEAMRSISEITTSNLEAWREFTTGKNFVDKYLYTDAISHLEKAVALDSNFAAAMLDLYPLYISINKNREAYQLAQKLLSLRNNCSQKEQFEIDLIAADLNKDDMKFLKTLEKWIKKFPGDRDAYMRMADVYRSWRNQEEEIKCYQQVLAVDPRQKVAYNRLAYANAYLGNYDEAVATIKKYKELAPGEVNPYDSAGEIYMMFGEYDKAERYLKKALKINKNFLHSIYLLENVYFFQGRYGKSLKMAKQYLKQVTSPKEEAGAYFMMGFNYAIQQDYEQAEKYYEQALEKNPFELLALDLLHDIYSMQNDSLQYNEQSQKVYSRLKALLNSDTQRTRALYALAWLAIFQDINREETLELLTQKIKELEQETNTPGVALYLMNLKFMLTLLYGQSEQYDHIDPLWVNQEIIPADFWRFLKDVHDNTYSEEWSVFGLLNKIFYKYPDHGFDFYLPLIQYASENQALSMEMMFRVFLADLYRFASDTINAEKQMRLIGVPYEQKWMVLGPFDFKDGFRKRYPPENKINLAKSYRQKSGTIKWQHANDAMEDGFINFSKIFPKENWAVAYAVIYIDSPDDQEVQFRFGTDDGSRIWLNDQEIWRLNRNGTAVFDDNTKTVTLKKGIAKIGKS